MTVPAISYSIENGARAIGISVSALRALIREGHIDAHYPTNGQGKPVVLHDDLMDLVKNAPTERRSA